jgi:C-terminal processing protease CtpA/Prc
MLCKVYCVCLLPCCLQEAQLPLPDGRVVQYVRLHYFTHEATAGLAQVVASAEAEGQHVAGYVLDLRNNPGGVFEEAVAIASLFQVRSLCTCVTCNNCTVSCG